MQKLDYVIVGGGVVGLAVGAALSPHGSVAVLERRSRLIEETSSRNSGVVHAGIYYPPQSLKTRLCMEGNANIWRLQKRFPCQIQARQIGKWIGACDPSEEPVIAQLAESMKARRLPFRLVPSDEIKEKEPLLHMSSVLESTSTGIVDVHSLRDFYVSTIESAPAGGYVTCHAEVTRVSGPPLQGATPSASSGPLEVTVQETTERGHRKSADSAFSIQAAKAVIFAVGLHANSLWDCLRVGDPADAAAPSVSIPVEHTLSFCKGCYATCRGKPPVSRLVYPCPVPHLVGLGVHSVVDMQGQIRFGPDAFYIDDPTDLRVGRTPEEEDAFLDRQWAAIQRYLPSLPRDRLMVDFAGVRPKLAGPGEPFRDFAIEEVIGVTASDEDDAYRAVMAPLTGAFHPSPGPRLVVLNGIESPGLTASSALGDYVCRSLVEPDSVHQRPSPWVSSAPLTG